MLRASKGTTMVGKPKASIKMDLSKTQTGKKKMGRPRKPDHELKYKRKSSILSVPLPSPLKKVKGPLAPKSKTKAIIKATAKSVAKGTPKGVVKSKGNSLVKAKP
jgi:hypothetical protein